MATKKASKSWDSRSGYAVRTGFVRPGANGRSLEILLCPIVVEDFGPAQSHAFFAEVPAGRKMKCGSCGAQHDVIDLSEAIEVGVIVAENTGDSFREAIMMDAAEMAKAIREAGRRRAS